MEMNYQVLIEDLFKSKEDFLRSFSGVSLLLYGKKIEDTDDIEKYLILGQMLKTYMLNIWRENKDEIKELQEAVAPELMKVIIKFGRFIPDRPHKYDELLGIELASDN